MTGDKDAQEETTFSFPIKNNIMTNLGTFYVGANATITSNGKEYAISRLNRNARAFEPLTPEIVTLNGTAERSNPLFGQKNNALGILKPAGGSDLLVAVTDIKPAVVYLVQNLNNPKNMLLVDTPPLSDAAGLPSSGIINLITNNLAYVFAAVKPMVGNFGDNNSGIALLVRGNRKTSKEEQKEETVFGEVDAKTGQVTADPKAYPLDKKSALVNIDSDQLAAMQNSVAMHWSPYLERFFIGLQTTSNNGNNNGARAVVVGSLAEGGGIELFEIAPSSAFAQNNVNNIVGVRAPNTTVSLFDVKTMYTSTALNYLIVLGGNGTSQQSVYALPLVSSGDNKGMLANKNDTPENVYQNGDVQKFIARNFTHKAETQDEMTQSTDAAAQVGAGELLAGSITSLVVRDDTVYATVGDDIATNGASGIYSSQALFDASGKIKGWTQWQRTGGTTDFVFEGTLNTYDGTFIYATGSDDAQVNTVFQTTWSNGSPQGLLPVTTYFNSIFSVANGGIQNLQTFLPSTPGLSDISLMIAGGIGSLTLVQTGLIESGVLIPTKTQEFETIVTFENGTIDDFPQAKIITISGGALNDVGPITATEIGRSDTYGWLFVGGSDGLAVLTNHNGSGWNIAQEELGDEFDGLIPGMSFKTIGTYRFVKKLIYEDNFLFVITNDIIDRINLTTSDFGTNTLDVVTVATKETVGVVSKHGTLLDAIISQAYAVVATTGGLVRIANNKDIRTIQQPHSDNWSPVIIHETAGASTQLITATTTNRSQDITRDTGGQIYVLTSNEGFNQSRINRFSVSPLADNEPMQPTTLETFDDLFVKNILSFFLNFGNFNSIFATDGALYFASRSKNNAQPPRTVLTPGEPAPRVGLRNVGERSTTVAIKYGDGTEINAFVCSQASGSWITAGDFGIQVLE